MSDVEDSTILTPERVRQTGKTAKPDFYHGDRNKLEDWLLQLTLYFRFSGKDTPEEDRVPLAATYLRGSAEQWIKPYLIKYLDEENQEGDEVDQLFSDLDEFKKQIRQVFGAAGEISAAIRMVQTLRQTRSAAEYAATFRQYSILTEWNDKALMSEYRRGLKDSVKKELMRYGGKVDSFNDLINASIELDNKLYELSKELRNESRPGNKTTRTSSKKTTKTWKRYVKPIATRTTARTDWHDPDAMEIDNLQKDKKHKKEQDRRCYNCGKVGHIARNCRSKNKVTRQLNMLRVEPEEPGNDEWEIVSQTERMEIRPHRNHMGPDSPAPESSYEEDCWEDEWDAPPTKQQKINDFIARHRQATPIPPTGMMGPSTLTNVEKIRHHILIHDQQVGMDGLTRLNEYLRQIETGVNAAQIYYDLNCVYCQHLDATGESREFPVHILETAPHLEHAPDMGHTPEEENPDMAWRTPRYQANTSKKRSLSEVSPRRPWGYRNPLYDPEDNDPVEPEEYPLRNCMGQTQEEPTASQKQEIWQLIKHQTQPEYQAEPEEYETPSEQCPQWNDDKDWYQGNSDKENEDPCGATRSTQKEYQNFKQTTYRNHKALQNSRFRQKHHKLALGIASSSAHIPARALSFTDHPRHPKHGTMSWIDCYHDECGTHYSDKQATNYWPSSPRRCRYQAYDCKTDACPTHIFAKREAQYFPGKDQEDIIIMRMSIDGHCTQPQWYTCLNVECTTHRQEKVDHGFGNEPFLGVRMTPTGSPTNSTKSDLEPLSSSR